MLYYIVLKHLRLRGARIHGTQPDCLRHNLLEFYLSRLAVVAVLLIILCRGLPCAFELPFTCIQQLKLRFPFFRRYIAIDSFIPLIQAQASIITVYQTQLTIPYIFGDTNSLQGPCLHT